MPRINGRWEYAMGIAGIQGSILGNLIPDAYGPYWIDDDNVVFPQPSDEKLIKMNVASGLRTQLSANSSNEYRAGGGNWAQWADNVGVVAPNFQSAKAGLKDVGPDGAIAFTPDYQVGIGTEVVELSGERWTLATGIEYDVQLLGNKRAIWRDELFKIQTYGIPGCVQVGKAYRPRAILVEDKWWVCYWSDGLGLLLHPFNSTVGYLVISTDAFQHVAGFSTPYVNVGWSATQGEGPADYRNRIINIATEARRELNQNPVPAPSEEVMIPAFERPMWMAPFFSYHTRYGDTPPDKYTGNAIIQLADDTNQDRFPTLGQPLIVDKNCQSPNLDLTVAWYASGGTISELQSAVSDALVRSEKPVIAYLDGRSWPDTNPFNSDRVWPAIQCYRGTSESLDTFRGGMVVILDRVKAYGLPIVLVTRFDDFNGSSTIERTLECMPLYEEWMRNYAIVGHLPFADKRGNGIANNPPLWDWARAFQYAIPFGRPNRFDYWKPSGSSNKQILENKFGQTRASVVIEPYLRTDILNHYNNTPPVPQPGVWPNLLPRLEAERKKYGATMNADQCVEMLNAVARAEGNGWGLIGKTGGNHGSQPITGIACSVDWLVNNQLHKGTDCLADAGDSTANYAGAANPYWPEDGEAYDGSRFVEPV